MARIQRGLALDTLGGFGDIWPMSVQIHTAKESNGTVVQLQGKVDATSAPSVEQALVGVIDQGEKRLVLDCAGLDFISSAGLRSLLLAVKKMKAAGGAISLAALQPNVKEVFDISGFSALFTIHGSKADALK
ncbi:MAG: STAS domain-containing protein [Verrucomicrobia bacterium]|nr:STAS domain-containing protein [Verrucomicrobiota bacterium]MDA1339988.1 STAS domain-containing protein [Verrucomicrobiota bacterium]